MNLHTNNLKLLLENTYLAVSWSGYAWLLITWSSAVVVRLQQHNKVWPTYLYPSYISAISHSLQRL